MRKEFVPILFNISHVTFEPHAQYVANTPCAVCGGSPDFDSLLDFVQCQSDHHKQLKKNLSAN